MLKLIKNSAYPNFELWIALFWDSSEPPKPIFKLFYTSTNALKILDSIELHF